MANLRRLALRRHISEPHNVRKQDRDGLILLPTNSAPFLQILNHAAGEHREEEFLATVLLFRELSREFFEAHHELCLCYVALREEEEVTRRIV